ncbi:MAG: methyl-accepting chemotaxis protein [Proteobacteria bacterium]|nr:HAMP domain-containing protein [Pseudomonadota bacterium]NOG59641.1 methyl-accepting chemotaxis protein [Pseudomonadota bacterium]
MIKINSVKAKIMALAFFPLVIALCFMFSLVLDKYRLMQDMKQYDKLSSFTVNFGGLLHDFQRERGASGIFLGSKGEKFKDELNTIRKQTDAKILQFRTFMESFNSAQYGVELQEQLDEVFNNITELKQIRDKVDTQFYTPVESLTKYSVINKSLLDVVVTSANFGSNAQMSKKRAAYLYFIQGKERAGIERAILAGTFTQDYFSDGVYNMFASQLTMQDTYFDVFKTLATPEELTLYNDFLSQPAVAETQRLRNIAISKVENSSSAKQTNFGFGMSSVSSSKEKSSKTELANFGVDGEQWFKTISAKINLMKDMENVIADDLIALSNDLKKSAEITLITLLVLAVIVTGIVLYTVITVTQNLTSRLNSAVEFAKKISDGCLNDSIEIIGNDEVGILSGALNDMSNVLRETIQNVEGTAHQLAQSADGMSKIAAQTSLGVSQQQSELQLVSTAMTEMSHTVSQVSENANGAKNATHEANNEAQNGRQIVDESTNSINTLANEIDHANTVIKQLETETTNIGSVLNVIGDIAEQTNLLALNAAIEAARAGEQGRGFSVVADEVRTLANRTQQSTLEIKKMIDTLQTGASEAVRAMDKGRGMAEKSVEQATRACGSLESIARSFATVSELNDQIAISTDQQSEVALEIDKNIITINSVAADTSSGASQTEEASNELTQLAKNLKQTLSKFAY